MQLSKIKNKKAALELSIGTVVIIVLAMSMLILGIVLINKIFGTATGAINGIDAGVKDQINRLFSENSEKTLILYPDSGNIEIERGSRDSGFAIALRNLDEDAQQPFTYTVTVANYDDCPSDPVADNKVELIGKTEPNIPIGPGEKLQNPRFVRLAVSDSAPLCTFRLKVEVTGCGTKCPQSATMDVVIVPE